MDYIQQLNHHKEMHTTNYVNTFIEIAEDCPVSEGTKPPLRGGKMSIANHQYDMLIDHPYKYTSDDVMFRVYAERKDIPEDDYEQARTEFFSRGQPCFRASPLTKRYGWGVHSNIEGRVAVYGVETEEYERLLGDESIVKVKAMRSSRK